MNKTKTRGGARLGAGRPQTGRTKSLTIMLTDELYNKVSVIPNKSKFMCELLSDYYKNNEDQ